MFKHAKFILTSLLLALLTAGCAAGPAAQATAAGAEQQPVKQDPALVISLAEVQALVAQGPEAGNYQLIDSRPEVKFAAGHIPTAISIPKPLLEQNLDKLAKDKLLVFYCGGVTCALSSKSAEIAQKNGFDNVKVFYAGMPAWSAGGNYAEVELDFVKKLALEGGKEPFLLVDARPAVKYQKSFIPGAISLPKAEFELKKGLLPADKTTALVFYCGGYSCQLSHKSAQAALALGYSNVSVFAAGEPAWRDAGLPLWGNEASGVVAQEKKEGLPENIDPQEFTQLLAAGKLQVVDVREPEEYAKGHIRGAINVFDEDFIFKPAEAIAKLATDRRVVLVCSTGARSASSYYAVMDAPAPGFANKARLQYLDTQVTYLANGDFKLGK